MKRRALLATMVLAAFLPAARAEDVTAYHDGDVIDPAEVARILSPDKTAAPGLTRSIRELVDGSAGTPEQAAQHRAQALSIPIRFEFDSSQVLPVARRQLDAIAEGIRRLPASRLVTIEGHTDAIGTDDYNLALSLRRATAVKNYLVRAQGIDPVRLREAGFGRRRPLSGTRPEAAENRRVQFRGG
ncbi:MAG TPA: OmpA family protein [Burkholderiaceae bacterium]|nr:OmpA family protein [Burkholderiaceae bacterium]